MVNVLYQRDFPKVRTCCVWRAKSVREQRWQRKSYIHQLLRGLYLPRFGKYRSIRPGLFNVKVIVLEGDAHEKLAPNVEMFTLRWPSWVKSVDGAEQFEKRILAPSS